VNTENYEFHEAANLFPMMDSESFESLKKDISANGLIEPIWLHEGKIIDGRNRYKACQEMAIDAAFRNWNGQGSLVQFVVSLNINRRHLTPSQKAAVAVEMLPMLEAEAKERQKLAGVEHAGNLKNQDARLVPELGQVGDSSRQPTAVRIAAAAVGVSHGNISEMKRISNAAPERVEEIKQGKTTVTAVIKELKQSGVIQPEIKKPKQEEKRDVKANPFSNALQFSTIAISQLTRIRAEDPQRVAALMEVRDYIDSQLKTKGE
jgi:ParB-like chromosome segregation protein Spo0J